MKVLSIALEMKNYILVLVLWGMCLDSSNGGSMGFFNSTEPVKRMAKIMMEECNETDAATKSGFADFLQRVAFQRNRLMADFIANSSNSRNRPASTDSPQDTTAWTDLMDTRQTNFTPSVNQTDNTTQPPTSGTGTWRPTSDGMDQADSVGTVEPPTSGTGTWRPTGDGIDQADSAGTVEPLWDLGINLAAEKQMDISTFLMLMERLMEDKDYGPRLTACVESSRSPEIAWDSIVANLSELQPQHVRLLMWGASPFLRRATAEKLKGLPLVTNSNQVQDMMKGFGLIYQGLRRDLRTGIFNWAKESLTSVQCSGERERPETEGLSGNGNNPAVTSDLASANCSSNWIKNDTLTILGLFLIDAPPKDFSYVTPQQVCRLLNDSGFPGGPSGMFDIDPQRAKRLLSLLVGSCINPAGLGDFLRLGALACYYDDAASFGKDNASALLRLLRSCRNKEVLKSVTMLVQALGPGIPVDGQMLRDLGIAASALSSSQLANISDRDIRNSISQLGQGLWWSGGQTRLLIRKFLKAGGQISSSRDLMKIGSLIKGVPSNILRNLSAEQLLQAVQAGLEEQASKLSTFQRKTIVATILQGVNSTVAIESLPGSLITELPLYVIQTADIRSIQEVKEKLWNRGQALYLCQSLSTNGSLPINELRQPWPLIQGVTCEMIKEYGDQFVLQIGKSLANNSSWLSRTQLACAAKTLKTKLGGVQAGASSQITDSLLEAIPSAFLLHLGEADLRILFTQACAALLAKMAVAEMALLPRSSPVRAYVREEALRCLGRPVSALNETDVARLGLLLCEFTGQNISDLANDTFSALIPQLYRCRQFSPTAGSSLVSKLLNTLGNVSDWTGDTVTSLGPLITLLEEDSLAQLPDTAGVKEALMQFAASRPSPGSVALPEFDTSFYLTGVYAKIFNILVGASGQAGSSGARADTCSVRPSTAQVRELGQANVQWTAEQLACVSVRTFVDTVEVLAAVDGFSQEQYVALRDKALQAWGSPSNFTQEDIANLKCIVTTLSVSELALLDLSSIDTLAIISGCPAWTQEQQSAVLDRFLDLGRMTAASLGPVELSGLGNFVCGMNSSLASQLGEETIRLAAASLGMLTCAGSSLDFLNNRVTEVFGPMKEWTAAEMSELGTMAAGASAEELKSLDPEVMPFLSTTAVRLILPDRFPVLSAAQVKRLGPENAAAVTAAQLERVSEEQRVALMEALGVPTRIKASTTVAAPAGTASQGFFRPSLLARALPAILLLSL
uniref:otoancorin-like isoform X2 n=1 Tax=Pristiophorus japonicus TaxID=55135 RepID=UPI00398EEBC5